MSGPMGSAPPSVSETGLETRPDQGVTERIAPPSAYILGMRVDRTDYETSARTVRQWAADHCSRYVCNATVNNVMEAHDSVAFRRLMNGADLVTPDGMPLVWGLRSLGFSGATRVYGPDLTPILLDMAASNGLPVGFYGGTASTLDRLCQRVAEHCPGIHVAYAFSPPFQPVTEAEDMRIVEEINRSGTRILFVGLNTPKQDYWMAAHKGRVGTVMVGVGAAFDFIAGTKSQAPRWMMSIGMEWLFRLGTEPRRLWKRYLKHNPRFVVLFALQLLGLKRFPAT